MSVDPSLLEAVFIEALDVPPEERASFVRRRCEDPALRARVERLLTAHDERVDGFLDPSAVAGLAAPALRPAVKLGRYAVLHEIGRGGMGIVYAAYDEELQRKVAVKQVRGGAANGGATRLRLEAKALARLQHPNVVAVHDVGDAGGQLFVAMELVDGEPLDQWAASRAPEEVLRTLVAAGKGLAHAHGQGILHRDFKPANVLVDKRGRARVADFGLATDVTSAARDAGPMGTAGYIAPEVLAGQPASVASDIYSYASALARLVRGRDGAFEWLEPLVRRGLSAEPRDRWTTLEELLAAVEHELSVDPKSDPRRGRAQRGRVFALFAAVVIAAAAGVAVAFWGGASTVRGAHASLYVSLLPAVGAVTLVVVFRRSLLATAFNRRGALSLVIVPTGIALQSALALRLGATLPSIFCADLVLVAAFLSGRAVSEGDRLPLGAAAVCVLGAGLIALVPERAALVFAGVVVAQLPLLYLHWAGKGRAPKQDV